MGWTGYTNTGFKDAIRHELAGYTVLARGAGVPGDENVTWFGLVGPMGEFVCQVLWRTYGRSTERETVIKLVSEDMGPLDVCVPDAVWDAVTPDPEHLGRYAHEWRQRVRAFREQYPMRIVDLRPVHRERLVAIPDRDVPVRYVGRLRSGRGECHVFDFPGEGFRRLPRGEERAQRCALADTSTATGTAGGGS